MGAFSPFPCSTARERIQKDYDWAVRSRQA
jgi:hypothetical protein